MTQERTNYKYLRLIGKFLTIFNTALLIVLIFAWLYTALFGSGLQPFELKWALIIFGIAFGEICKAIADIADSQIGLGRASSDG